MKRYQRLFALFAAPVLILVGALLTARVVASVAAVFDASFLLMYLLGLGSFWAVFFALDRAS
ncbi:hypothetical protein BRD03_05555 [Halobacteriales archaeon QS_9_68_17]|nr:MAG: hypothetical protein BRD03_05555 [Halobacteriales archaeon QS_9_68_17]